MIGSASQPDAVRGSHRPDGVPFRHDGRWRRL